MASVKPHNTAASVHSRLVKHAKAINADPNLVLIWYGLERLLYRLSVSPFRDRFVLKGAMLFRLWGGPEFRSTKDLDLLGFIRHEREALRDAFTAICQQSVDDDGLVFDPGAVRIAEIREQQEYGGLRVSLTAKLGNAVIFLQIDVGFGDAVTPPATTEDFPSILDQAPHPCLSPRDRCRGEIRSDCPARHGQQPNERLLRPLVHGRAFPVRWAAAIQCDSGDLRTPRHRAAGCHADRTDSNLCNRRRPCQAMGGFHRAICWGRAHQPGQHHRRDLRIRIAYRPSSRDVAELQHALEQGHMMPS